jgi:glycosyltransferase involved in cell wall biosynthesis
VILILGIIGITGVLGMTWLFPTLARLLPKSETKPSGARPLSLSAFEGSIVPPKISVLLPVYNDAGGLERTLGSISRAVEFAATRYPGFSVDLLVGLDGCTDDSAKVAAGFGARIVKSSFNRGKWRTIRSLVLSVQDSDWVVLADCGVVWGEDFLDRLIPELRNPEVIGVAPTYRMLPSSGTDTAIWSVESYFKGLEEGIGGPVSIHGATVAYRYSEVVQAFKTLKRRPWINDDIVLPLLLRSIFPSKSIRYFSELAVFDLSAGQANDSLQRRKRMTAGNIQWIRGLLPMILRREPAVGLVAFRRVFRVFWAYWVMLILLASGAYIAEYNLLSRTQFLLLLFVALLTMMTLVWKLQSVRRAWQAALASFIAPLYVFIGVPSSGVRWR